MKQALLLFLGLLVLISAPAAAGTGVQKLRAGMPGLFARLDSGEPVSAVYVGRREACRDAAESWIKRVSPRAVLTSDENSCSGTAPCGTLIIIEFLFDEKKPPHCSPEDAESYLRRLWRDDAAADVLFLYVFKTGGAGSGAPSAPYEFLADRCGVPSLKICRPSDIGAALDTARERAGKNFFPSPSETIRLRRDFLKETESAP